MKGDEGSSRHWFNRLDDLFSPEKPFFKRIFDAGKEKISHRRGNPNELPERFNSFCHIEKTAFTQRMAEVLSESNGAQLPIPSQDTIAWYCAQLWQEPVLLTNMRRWFKN